MRKYVLLWQRCNGCRNESKEYNDNNGKGCYRQYRCHCIDCVCVYASFWKKSKALEIIVCVVVAYLVITNAQAVWAWATSFVK